MLKKLFESAFYEADIFKVPFVLLFQNRKKSSTIIGSILSISIVAIVLYLFISSNMLLKINPNVIDQTTSNSHAELIELNPDNFEVAAGVANTFGKGFSDPTIFKINFLQIEMKFNETITSKQITQNSIIKTKPCTQSHFKDNATFGDLGLQNYTCLENGTFQIEGGFDEKGLKTIVVIISYCDNKTDGVVCKSQSDINTFIKDKGLWIYYQDDIYDVSNYQNPITKNWRLQAVQCASVSRIVDLYIKKLIFISDDQFIFSNEKHQYGFMKERVEFQSDYVIVSSPLVSINIFSSKNNQKTKRQYQKFGDLVASIGGIINVLIIVGFMITNLENQLQMENHIMNALYSYSYESRERLPKAKRKNKSCSPSRQPSAGKIEHHPWDWNNDYEEMLSKDGLNAKKLRSEREDREELGDLGREFDSYYKAQYKESSKNKELELEGPISKEQTHKDVEIPNNEMDFIGSQTDKRMESMRIYSKPIGWKPEQLEYGPMEGNITGESQAKPKLFQLDKKFFKKVEKKEDKLNQTEPSKSHFFANKLDMPALLIESARRFASPIHHRIISPLIIPKDLSVASENKIGELYHENRHFKDTDDSKPVTMKISEYLKLQTKLIFKTKLSEKERLFILSEKRFLKETDICYILEKIQEFEKFKLIILNQEQLTLFNLLAKPLIYLESRKEKFQRVSQSFSNSFRGGDSNLKNDAKKRIIELKKHYKKMSAEKNLSSIDKNLLQMIEDDIFIK